MLCIPRKQRGRLSALVAHISGERDRLPDSYKEASFTWEIPVVRQRSLAQGLGRET
jgi:hypothetical protein